MTSLIILSVLFVAVVLYVGRFTRFHMPDNDKELHQEERG